MRFVVKVSDATGSVGWLSPVGPHDIRCLVDIEAAEAFQSVDDARDAISQMRALPDSGIVFAVELAN